MAKKVNKKESKKEEQMSEKAERTVLVLLVIIIILLVVILGIVILKKNNNVGNINDSNYNVNVDDNDGIKVTDDIIDNQNTTNDNNYIARDSAISIALKDLKLTKNDVYDLECDLDREFNQIVYEVTFNYKNLEYEYYINAESGKIIHSFKELD